jgi:hypothetical protein
MFLQVLSHSVKSFQQGFLERAPETRTFPYFSMCKSIIIRLVFCLPMKCKAIWYVLHQAQIYSLEFAIPCLKRLGKG